MKVKYFRRTSWERKVKREKIKKKKREVPKRAAKDWLVRRKKIVRRDISNVKRQIIKTKIISARHLIGIKKILVLEIPISKTLFDKA